jgi:hypothetical protein
MGDFENVRWLVIPENIISTINFNEIIDSSTDSIRFSLDGTKAVVKYYVNEVLEDTTTTYINPQTQQTIENITKKGIYGRPSFYTEEYKEYNHGEILALLLTDEWTNKNLNIITNG